MLQPKKRLTLPAPRQRNRLECAVSQETTHLLHANKSAASGRDNLRIRAVLADQQDGRAPDINVGDHQREVYCQLTASRQRTPFPLPTRSIVPSDTI